MSPAEAIERVQAIRDNLVGAQGKRLRKDREALDVVLALVAKAPQS